MGQPVHGGAFCLAVWGLCHLLPSSASVQQAFFLLSRARFYFPLQLDNATRKCAPLWLVVRPYDHPHLRHWYVAAGPMADAYAIVPSRRAEPPSTPLPSAANHCLASANCPAATLSNSPGLTYAYVRRTVAKSTETWQGSYRPEQEEEKAMLKKQVQPLL